MEQKMSHFKLFGTEMNDTPFYNYCIQMVYDPRRNDLSILAASGLPITRVLLKKDIKSEEFSPRKSFFFNFYKLISKQPAQADELDSQRAIII